MPTVPDVRLMQWLMHGTMSGVFVKQGAYYHLPLTGTVLGDADKDMLSEIWGKEHKAMTASTTGHLVTIEPPVFERNALLGARLR